MEIVSTVASLLGDKFKSLFDSLLSEFGEEVKHIVNNNILEYQVEEYNRNFYAKTLLHRVQPKKLKDFYQPLFIRPCGKRTVVEKTTRIPTHSINSLFEHNQFLTIIGSAGSGKSTIIKYLFLNSIDTKFKIPIKVELRYLNDYDGSITDFIKDKIFKLNKLATHDKIIERLMISGDFVFFLDGYDEIASIRKERITKEIDDLVKLYNKNFYLLTSRPYTDIDLLPLFHNFEVCQLSDDDINQFIKKQIPSEEIELCNKIIEAVNSKENVSYKSFVSNPLLLSMFILTFQSYSTIPQKRSEFYSQVFDALFSVHDSMSKLAFVREKQSGLAKEQIIDVLKLFSFLSYFDERFIFSSIYLEEKLRFIKEKKRNLVFDTTKLINDLQIAIGVLNKEGTDYTFPHRSLQEYFAAIYISSLDNQNKQIIYNKIILSITDSKRPFPASARENFYLLICELDEKAVINYAVIPYLLNFENETDFNSLDYKKIIEYFVNINSFYQAFNSILKSQITFEANRKFNSEFHRYTAQAKSSYERKELRGLDKKNNIDEDCRKKLAMTNIKPFLKELLSEASTRRKSLEEYLISESETDSQIISII